jgi:hypothetical protein
MPRPPTCRRTVRTLVELRTRALPSNDASQRLHTDHHIRHARPILAPTRSWPLSADAASPTAHDRRKVNHSDHPPSDDDLDARSLPRIPADALRRVRCIGSPQTSFMHKHPVGLATGVVMTARRVRWRVGRKRGRRRSAFEPSRFHVLAQLAGGEGLPVALRKGSRTPRFASRLGCREPRSMADPREQFEGQVRRGLGHVRSRLLATQKELQEKQRRLRQRQDEYEERRRNGR